LGALTVDSSLTTSGSTLAASVLLVDDHPAHLAALEDVLQPLGLRLVRARSGAEALDRVHAGAFAAVLLAAQIPGMDGFETTARIRRDERTRDVAVVLLAPGTVSLDDMKKGYAHGAVDVLARTIDPDLLRAKVMALVDLWRRGESIRAREASLHERERAALLSAVHQTEAELRLIIDGVRDHAISLLDEQGCIRTFNKPAERIKGYALAEVQGRHFEMFFTPEDRAGGLPQRELTEAAANGRFEGEGWRQRKDGSRFYAAVSLSPLRDHDGALVGFVKVTQDITERRRLSEELRLRESQLRLIIDGVRDHAISLLDPEGRIITFNAPAERIKGYRLAEVEGRHFEMFFTPEDRAGGLPQKELSEAAAHGRFEGEGWRQRKDGSRFYAAVSLSALRDQEGRLVGFVKVTQDVTERKLAAERVSEEAAVNETLYRIGTALATNLDLDTIFQQLTDEATKVCRAQFGAFFYNAKADTKKDDRGSYLLYVLSGVARETFAGFPMPRNTAVFGPTFAGTGVVRSDDITRDPRYGRNEPYNGMPPGHLPVRSYLAVPVMSRSGQVHGGLFFGHAEAGVFKERDERVVVAIATQAAVAIDNAQLFAAAQRDRARAEEANRAKDLFLSSLSHELRTPLNAIMGWARMLRSGSLSEANRLRGLEVIDRNTRAQASLIEDILDLSRITAGKMRLNVAPVEIVQVVEAALDTVRPAGAAKGVRIQAVLDPDCGIVHGDATRLQQICWNLLSNAVKFTPRGGRVYVRLVRTDSQVELLVSDTGKGIDPAFLPAVFDRFSQADSTTTREHGGLGLGLAIVKHLVELHGGTVSADSEGKEKGATFTVRLPVAPVRAPAVIENPVPAVTSVPGPGLECPPELAGLRVLVVDDESDARELIRTVLESCNAKVTTVATAPDALRLFQEHPPDVLLSDIGMMGHDGYWLIRQVRALPAERGGRVPAVAITAYAAIKDRTRALMEGFTNHISKPTEPEELLAVVAAIAGRTSGTPPPVVDSKA
jgi:PAS domain S-box-containing protein